MNELDERILAAAKKWIEADKQPWLTSEGYANGDHFGYKREAEWELRQLGKQLDGQVAEKEDAQDLKSCS